MVPVVLGALGGRGSQSAFGQIACWSRNERLMPRGTGGHVRFEVPLTAAQTTGFELILGV